MDAQEYFSKHLSGDRLENKISKKLFSITEFMSAYSVSRSQYYILVREKKLKIVKMGRRPMIRLDDAEAWASSLERVE